MTQSIQALPVFPVPSGPDVPESSDFSLLLMALDLSGSPQSLPLPSGLTLPYLSCEFRMVPLSSGWFSVLCR